MKLSIARGALLDSLSVVTKALSARTTLPILSGILMTATKDGITLQSTDLEISIRDFVAADVEGEGSIVVPGRLLTDVVRKMPEAAIKLETSGADKIEVSCRSEKAGVISFSLRTLPADDFPRFPEVSPDQTVTIPTPLMASMVRQVSKAVSRDEARPILTGVLLVMDGTEIRMVATDSYRLAIRTSTTENPVEERVEVVIPGKALDEIPKIAASSPTVKMGVSENQIVFEFGHTTYVTRRIEGTFPNYRQLVPADGETNIVIDRSELAEAAQRVSLLAQHNAPLRLKIADNTLTLSATTQDVGEASEDLMVEMDGQPLEIAFNHAFLLDGIAASDDEKLAFMASSPLKPGVFKSTGADEYVYLIMPVRP
jgi:DNA polymerase-3 subunit beta